MIWHLGSMTHTAEDCAKVLKTKPATLHSLCIQDAALCNIIRMQSGFNETEICRTRGRRARLMHIYCSEQSFNESVQFSDCQVAFSQLVVINPRGWCFLLLSRYNFYSRGFLLINPRAVFLLRYNFCSRGFLTESNL